MDSIAVVIAQLRQVEKLDTYQDDVTDADVTQLAALTGCVLPSDYVEFLKSCGFASWVGHSVYGIFDMNDERFPSSYCFSAAEQTARARALHHQDPYPFHGESIVIDKDGMGGYFLLLSENVPGSNRVVWVNRDEEWMVTMGWGTFADFLAYQLLH